jgi:hypothetical protein
MEWKKLLASITGSVDQELLRNAYLVTENRLLRNQLQGRVRLTDPGRKTLAEVGMKLRKQALEEVATITKNQPSTRSFGGVSSPGEPQLGLRSHCWGFAISWLHHQCPNGG